MNCKTDDDMDLQFLAKFLGASDTSIIADDDGVVFKLDDGKDFAQVKYPHTPKRRLRRKTKGKSGS